MARKFDLISELYERTCFAVTDNPVNWQSFLKTAGKISGSDLMNSFSFMPKDQTQQPCLKSNDGTALSVAG